MSTAYFNVCAPREVGLARFVIARLGRPEWLDIPWVHATTSLDLAHEIVEDADDFPPALMAEASLVSLALRIAAIGTVPDMFLSVRNFAFYPTVTHDRLRELLRPKGFEERQPPPADRAEIEREPTPREARHRLFDTLYAPPDTPLLRVLFWEHCEDDPADGAKRIADSSALNKIVFGCPPAERAALTNGVRRLAERIPSGSAVAFLAACGRGGLDAALLEEIAKRVPVITGDPPRLTTAVARALYAKCGPETKKRLVERDAKLFDLALLDDDANVRAFVAPRVTQAGHITALSRDPSQAVRFALSMNARVDAATIERLASEAELPDHVALALAKHPNSSADLLLRLVDHVRADVRSALAKHPALPAEAVKRLATDDSAIVRLVVAKRPGLAPELLAAFRTDPAEEVRAVGIAAAPNASADELASVPPGVRLETRTAVARASTDAVLLSALATDASNQVRIAVGLNACTPLESLERLSRDPDGYVRGAVAGNPAAGASVLGRLAVDEVHQIRQMAAASLGKLRKAAGPAADGEEIPPEIEEVLLDPMAPPRRELTRQKELGRAVLEALSDDADTKVRCQLVRSKATPADLLDRLACDVDVAVRAAVAATPRASERAVALLLEDECFAVRAAASERWQKLQATASKRKAKK